MIAVVAAGSDAALLSQRSVRGAPEQNLNLAAQQDDPAVTLHWTSRTSALAVRYKAPMGEMRDRMLRGELYIADDPEERSRVRTRAEPPGPVQRLSTAGVGRA